MARMQYPRISYTYKGDWKKTFHFLEEMKRERFIKNLDKYGRLGVEALRKSTPRDTGLTAESWDYEITSTRDSVTISWTNSNTNKTVPIALLIQYGHGTRTGGYVTGVDYINPALKPIFDEIADAAWKEIESS